MRPAHARGARGGPVRRLRRRRGGAAAPAETETSFEHFLWLIRGYANRRASFYLQKHALRKWEAHGLRADASPPPHEKLAPFLRLQHELLWMSTHCTVGPLHYDEQENLHAVVLGAKRFELFHPSAGGAAVRRHADAHNVHLWRWDNASRRGHLHALDPLTAPPAHQPFSPVSVRRPDARRHPRFGGAKRLECEVKAGEVLYVPSYWWHEVTSLPQDDALPPTSPSAGALPAEIGGGGAAAGAGRGLRPHRVDQLLFHAGAAQALGPRPLCRRSILRLPQRRRAPRREAGPMAARRGWSRGGARRALASGL